MLFDQLENICEVWQKQCHHHNGDPAARQTHIFCSIFGCRFETSTWHHSTNTRSHETMCILGILLTLDHLRGFYGQKPPIWGPETRTPMSKKLGSTWQRVWEKRYAADSEMEKSLYRLENVDCHKEFPELSFISGYVLFGILVFKGDVPSRYLSSLYYQLRSVVRAQSGY